MKFENLTDNDLDREVCRYLTFPKFINMLSYSAIWFSKLNILQDKFEGMIPHLTKREMVEDYKKWKTVLPERLHPQLAAMAEQGEQSGRELLVVSCWYLGKPNSPEMWEQYAGGIQGVAITSTIRKMSKCICILPEVSRLGKVDYVDFESHKMGLHKAHQAFERAFLKDIKYAEEKEFRIATFNWKHGRCVNMEGEKYTQEQCSGKNTNNFENPGLYIQTDIATLINSIIFPKNGPRWIKKTVSKILKLSQLCIPTEKSSV